MADSLYVIGIGGTGAKCLEAILQMAGVGLFTENPIKLLFVDADENNGNLERARESLKIYQKCYKLLKSEQKSLDWMQTGIDSYKPDLWSPFAKSSVNKDLESFFGYTNLTINDPALGNLFDVLYTEEERKANLDVGFRGRSSIGAAIMSGLDLNDLYGDPWTSLIGNIKGDAGAGQKPRIFLCGSIFGGTGAAGLPTLGRLIYNKLEKENIKASVKIACLFVLPYFQFQPIGNEAKGEVYASSDQFLLNTEAALRYYLNQNQYFDMVYLLGSQNFPKYKFSIGKNTQRNEPHFIELYAALAARHFLLYLPAKGNKVVLTSRTDDTRLIWQDLPDMTTVKSKLANGVRFAYVWLGNILPELNLAKDIGSKNYRRGSPWIDQFFRPHQGFLGNMMVRKGQELPDFNDEDEKTAIAKITEWCEDYLRWIVGIHEGGLNNGDQVELFSYGKLKVFDDQIRGEYLSELVMGDERDLERKQHDTVQKVQEQLLDVKSLNLAPPNTGAVGLAKALYRICAW